MTENQIHKYKKIAASMRTDILRMSVASAKSGLHFGGSFSLVEILTVLYGNFLKFNLDNPKDESRDRLILSKGHGVPAFYAALKQIGFITESDLDTFKTNITFLYGHPCLNIEKGIEASTGSLGQGISFAAGMALALKTKGNDTSKVFVILGDGECNEGSVWEAAMASSHYKLSNLTVIVDKNNLQYDGPTENVMSMESLGNKFQAFGFDTVQIDGHNFKEIYNALSYVSDKPKAIIAKTVKGKGISFMENNPLWHHGTLNKDQYIQAVNELEVEQ